MAAEKKNGEKKVVKWGSLKPWWSKLREFFGRLCTTILHATKKDDTPHAEKLEEMNEIRAHTQSSGPQCLFMIDQSNIYAFSAN